MGWTSFKLNEPIKEWFKNNWESDSRYKVLDCAVVKFNAIYAAIQRVETGDVFCAVYLISWNNKSYYNFSYKDMTEYAGPGAVECPEKIFKLLTPLVGDDNGWAAEWRNNVKNFHKIRKAFNKGKIIKTEREYEFMSGHKFNLFKKEGKRTWGCYEYDDKIEPVRSVRFNPSSYRNSVIYEK